jgi:hypothetical protein
MILNLRLIKYTFGSSKAALIINNKSGEFCFSFKKGLYKFGSIGNNTGFKITPFIKNVREKIYEEMQTIF